VLERALAAPPVVIARAQTIVPPAQAARESRSVAPGQAPATQRAEEPSIVAVSVSMNTAPPAAKRAHLIPAPEMNSVPVTSQGKLAAAPTAATEQRRMSCEAASGVQACTAGARVGTQEHFGAPADPLLKEFLDALRIFEAQRELPERHQFRE